MLFRLIQSLKALRAMDVTVLGNVMEDMPLHPSKEEPPIDVNPLERLTEVRPLQSSKAELPMDVTVLGMSRDVILLH